MRPARAALATALAALTAVRVAKAAGEVARARARLTTGGAASTQGVAPALRQNDPGRRHCSPYRSEVALRFSIEGAGRAPTLCSRAISQAAINSFGPFQFHRGGPGSVARIRTNRFQRHDPSHMKEYLDFAFDR